MKSLNLIPLLFLICVCFAHAEGSVGFSFNQVIDDRSWGIVGEYERDMQAFEVDVDGQLQSGDIYRGKTDVSITFDVSSVGVALYSNNTLKGYELATLGRVNDVGAALVVPTGDLEVSVGFFGRNGNPFAKPSALATLVPLGFSETELERLGLADIYPGDKGLSIEDGSSLNASVETAFEVDRFEVDIKALLEILGSGHRTHQLLSNISTDGTLLNRFHWRVAVDIGAQLFGDVIEYETAWLMTLGYHF